MATFSFSFFFFFCLAVSSDDAVAAVLLLESALLLRSVVRAAGRGGTAVVFPLSLGGAVLDRSGEASASESPRDRCAVGGPSSCLGAGGCSGDLSHLVA